MTEAHLFPTDPPSGLASTADFTFVFEFGNAFTPAVNGYLRELAWWRGQTGANVAPTSLRLWDTTTGTVVGEAPAIPDSGLVGRQAYTFTTNVLLIAGRQYRASACWPSGTHPWVTSTYPTPDPPLAFTASPRWFNANSCGYPNSQNASTNFPPVDAVWTDTAPGTTPPATSPDVANALADWFDPTDATKPTGTPKLYPDTILGLNGKIDNDGVTWDAKLGPMISYGGVGNHGISFGVDVVRQQSVANGAALAALPTPASPGDVAALQSDLDAFVAATTANFQRLYNAVSVPGAGWALIDTTTFDTSLTWSVPGDLYVVNFTVTPDRIKPTDVAGLAWFPHLAWWAVLNGDFVQGERRFLDFAQAHLVDNGRRMPGLALHANYGGEGTVEAWQLS